MNHDDFLNMCKNTNPSSEVDDAKQLALIKSKLNKESYTMKKTRMIKPSIAIAAALITVFSLTAAAFGQDIVRYVRTIALGNYVTFYSGQVELSEEEMQARREEAQAMIDSGEVTVVTETTISQNWLTFTDIEEGRSHFITDIMLPTYLPEGFEFQYMHFFVETLEELAQYGANKYLSVIFSNGTDELRMQIRYMTEETGFAIGGSNDIQTAQINGHEAVIESGMVSLLVGDVLYMFFNGRTNVNTETVIRMAESMF